MEKQIITEEMGLHKEWFVQAKDQTVETLPEFLRHLSEDYQHDYGTMCHAVSAASIATAWAMNSQPGFGLTGFQAGFVMWGFIQHWTKSHNKTGLRLVDWDDMLYPQYEDKFQKTISPETWEALQKEALKLLEENRESEFEPAIRVRNHWRSIAAGNIPFGYEIGED